MVERLHMELKKKTKSNDSLLLNYIPIKYQCCELWTIRSSLEYKLPLVVFCYSNLEEENNS